jgi:hypothetical protein
MTKSGFKWLAVAAVMAAAPFATKASAQVVPTPEGTVIVNTATVGYKDANNNTYSATGAVSITVGYKGAIDVTGNTTASPGSPSTGNSIVYTITNVGNGVDTASVAVTVPAGITMDSLIYNGSKYADATALNLALATVQLAPTASYNVTVFYSVAGALGGQSRSLVFAATTKRTPTATDNVTTVITPPVVNGVTVTANQAAQSNLPSNGVQYTISFHIANGANATKIYDLTAASSVPSTATIVSVNGTPGAAGTITLTALAQGDVNVVYTVADVTVGLTSTITLTAVSQGVGSVTDDDATTVTVIKPVIQVIKTAFRDDQVTQINPTDRVTPGELIWYKLEVKNTAGTAPANTVTMSDVLSSSLAYTGSAQVGGWVVTHDGSTSGGTVSATLPGTLAVGASTTIWIHVSIR